MNHLLRRLSNFLISNDLYYFKLPISILLIKPVLENVWVGYLNRKYFWNRVNKGKIFHEVFFSAQIFSDALTCFVKFLNSVDKIQ